MPDRDFFRLQIWKMREKVISQKTNTMKRLLLIVLLLSAKLVSAQTVLEFQAAEQMSRKPISQLQIRPIIAGDTLKGVYTNSRGKAYMTITQKDSVSFDFFHVAYDVQNPPAKTLYKSKDTVRVNLKLFWIRVNEIDEIVIKPPGQPDTVFQSDRLSVQDFEFLPNGKMVLLTYPKNIRKGTEVLLFDGFNVLGEIPVKEKGIELIRDYKGQPHIVTENSVYGINTRNERIHLSNIDKKYYMTYIAPIVDTTVTKYFFSNYSEVYPAFDYFTYDLMDSTYKKIVNIEDNFMMELYRAEYKWVDVRTKLWAKEKENETGIDAEVWVGATYFTQSIYYKELYAPMFERNDSIFVFDHYKNWMYRFSANGTLMDSLPIYYHLKAKENGWKKLLLQDQTTGQVYIVYENAGKTTLQRFDCATGKLGEIIPLYFKYAENLAVRDNKVYYVYRPFESTQKKFLYDEKLPISYSAVTINGRDNR